MAYGQKVVVIVGETVYVTAASILMEPVLAVTLQPLLSVTVTLYTVPVAIVGVPVEFVPKLLFHE